MRSSRQSPRSSHDGSQEHRRLAESPSPSQRDLFREHRFVDSQLPILSDREVEARGADSRLPAIDLNLPRLPASVGSTPRGVQSGFVAKAESDTTSGSCSLTVSLGRRPYVIFCATREPRRSGRFQLRVSSPSKSSSAPLHIVPLRGGVGGATNSSHTLEVCARVLHEPTCFWRASACACSPSFSALPCLGAVTA